MLYLEGPLGSGKTTRLLTETARLLETYPASSILVLCSNHARQQQFIERLLTLKNAPLAQLPIYTYAGFVRNALFNYWPLAEAEIADTLKRGVSVIRPELSGLEDTELILGWLLTRLRHQWAAQGREPFPDFPGTERHIIKQIVRRLRLRSENMLTRPEMRRRSELLDEICREETAWLERQFDIESYALRVLDPNKQLDIFNSLLRKDNLLSRDFRGSIRHLVVDDVDETIPAQQKLIEWLAPSLENLILAADVDGGSRRGYLNAYPYDWQALKALRPGTIEALSREDAPYRGGQALLANWQRPEDFRQSFTAMPDDFDFKLQDAFVTRVEMLAQVVEDVLEALHGGKHPGDFCIVLPKADFLSFHQLQSRLAARGVPVQLLSGTKRPSDNPKCRAFITLLQWVNLAHWRQVPSRWEVKTVLVHALHLDYVPGVSGEMLDRLGQSIAEHLQAAELPECLLPVAEKLSDAMPLAALARYKTLDEWLRKAAMIPFERQIYLLFNDVLAPFSSEKDTYADLSRVIQGWLRQRAIYEGFSKTGEPSSQGLDTPDDFNRWWLQQVKTGEVADTPEMPEAIRPDALVIATPQKVIDHELRRPVQLWLDVGSREWARSDNAPLYNAWVHSAVWDGNADAFGEEFNEAVIRARAGHITRALMMLAGQAVRAYASELDDMGFSQVGLLKPRLLPGGPPPNPDAALERAVLRADQADILQYRRGMMAISAVPGAGKTFVNVELLLELITKGVAPDSILVLTYMDSAAKTLLSRLKRKLSGVTNRIPVVSTIHSLAFRILTENDHALLVHRMADDMTILDDYGRGDVLGRIASATMPESARNPNDWQRAIDRGISHAKMLDLSTDDVRKQVAQAPDNFRLREFLPAIEAYQAEMHRNGFLDFTDLITQAVRILQAFPDIRKRYQRQFAYIIEDEAQDSSRLLQAFIHLLGGDKPNLVRTGDTNQSITTTFSSADTGVFRDFIRQADQVVRMDHSGRCAPEIINLANFWMTAAAQQPALDTAFEPVAMRPVPGQNPELLQPPSVRLFDIDRMEEEWLVERIRQLRDARPDLSVAVLTRTNAQVNRVTAMLHQAKIPAVSLSEQLNISPVFGLILAYLRLLAFPGDLDAQALWYRRMTELQVTPELVERRQFMETMPLLYQNPLDLPDAQLKQWLYDGLEHARMAAGGNIASLIAHITDQFFVSVADRSNGYLCALMARDILDEHLSMTHLSPLEIVIHRFESFQASWRGKKSFSEMLSQQPHELVQVMSIHKSKGQEFDVVFMPFLQADSFPHDPESIRFDEADRLLQELDRLKASLNGKPLSETYMQDKKREKIEEEARLVYVGITRARRALILSAHRQELTKYHKLRTVAPALAFELLSERLRPVLTNVGEASDAQPA